MAGIQESFQALVEEHKRILYKVCHSYCRNRDDREDLAQEIIVQLWRSFPSFDPQYRFSTWMYRISLNVAISFYRRERTRAHYLADGEEILEVADDAASHTGDVRLLYRFIEARCTRRWSCFTWMGIAIGKSRTCWALRKPTSRRKSAD